MTNPSEVRLSALHMAIDTLNHNHGNGPTATDEQILHRAASFEQYLERGKPEECKAVSEEQPFSMPTPRILGIEEQLRGASISSRDAKYLINAINIRTRS